MRKLAAFALLGVFALAGCWSSAGGPPPPPPPPPPPTPTPAPCTDVTGKVATIAVDRDGVANPECVSIDRGNTIVVWHAGGDVRELTVTFKPVPTPPPGHTSPPDHPDCAGATCVLEKAKQAAKKGTFRYDVKVVRTDGSEKTEDPRLIIDP